MKPLDTIVAGTVFGPRSDAAVRIATTLAEAFRSKTVLVHAVHEQAYSVIAEHPGIPELERRLRERHAQSGNVNAADVEVVVVRGSAARAIVETAATRFADLIVVGAGTPTDSGESRIGSTTSRVVRNSPVPVWIVAPNAAAKPSKILCPVDTSEASRRALKNAHFLSQVFEADLTVLHVLEPLSTLYAGIDMPDDAVEMGFLSPQKQRFEEFLGDLGFRDESWSVTTLRGKPHEQIIAHARESSTDLIVMGTVGRAGVARLLLGSVTEKVTRQLPCSILTVKAKELVSLRVESDLESIDKCLLGGRQLLEAGEAAKALREFDRCLSISPTLVVAWNGKAQAYEHLGENARAAQSRENAERIAAWLRETDSNST